MKWKKNTWETSPLACCTSLDAIPILLLTIDDFTPRHEQVDYLIIAYHKLHIITPRMCMFNIECIRRDQLSHELFTSLQCLARH